ncbi:MAG: hypothetical protein Ct9H300mP1_34400 [Planctomycetaceae bacterium]|nr:MAG: hypothetical protein Ct9H300mP1_34400 [Planctomycetaceae bacterium]
MIKTRIAFEQLVSQGLGDTIRVSLTVPNDRKSEEIEAGRQILADIAADVSAPSSISDSTRSTSSAAPVARGSRTRRSSSWPNRSAR